MFTTRYIVVIVGWKYKCIQLFTVAHCSTVNKALFYSVSY